MMWNGQIDRMSDQTDSMRNRLDSMQQEMKNMIMFWAESNNFLPKNINHVLHFIVKFYFSKMFEVVKYYS
ncbi:hypothetical protein AB205_0075410 [Aquarana catesbeiana]|uniref:Uncharacterized protein n=1 Tax=Aquarana catesbeiana TaxID=8400 RepID=A0A2G9S5W8_AQUCT|nr:hypothetical protein AB205_0075410 [Aquarana catesbeiana]